METNEIESTGSISPERFLQPFHESDKKGYCNCNIVDLLRRPEVLEKLARFRLPIILGLDQNDNVQMCDLADPQNGAGSSNIIVAGRTCVGKSTFAMYNVACLLLKSIRDVGVYVWTYEGMDFKRSYIRAPGVTIFEGYDEFEVALSIVGKLVKSRAERVCSAGCKTLDEYNVKHPDGVLPRYLFVLDGCDFAAQNRRDVGRIEYLMREAPRSGVHLIAMAQAWACEGKALKSVARLFGRKMCFDLCLDAIEGAFDNGFVSLVSRQANGEAFYDDGFGTVMKLKTPLIACQDFHRLGEWRMPSGCI